MTIPPEDGDMASLLFALTLKPLVPPADLRVPKCAGHGLS